MGENRVNSATDTTDKLRYFYDATGLTGFSSNGVNYVYVKDELGNITKILKRNSNLSLTLEAQYVYNAWGVLNKRGRNKRGRQTAGKQVIVRK